MSTVKSTDMMLASRAGTDYRVTVADFLAGGGSGGSTVKAWGVSLYDDVNDRSKFTGSFNVSSITNTAAGAFNVSFATPLADIDYAVQVAAGMGQGQYALSAVMNWRAAGGPAVAPTTSGFSYLLMDTETTVSTLYDYGYVNFIVFR